MGLWAAGWRMVAVPWCPGVSQSEPRREERPGVDARSDPGPLPGSAGSLAFTAVASPLPSRAGLCVRRLDRGPQVPRNEREAPAPAPARPRSGQPAAGGGSRARRGLSCLLPEQDVMYVNRPERSHHSAESQLLATATQCLSTTGLTPTGACPRSWKGRPPAGVGRGGG